MIKPVLRKIKRIVNKQKNDGSFVSKYPILLDNLNKILKNTTSARTPYAWGVLSGVDLAQTLGLKKVSVIEFGVAGGTGLVSLEQIAEIVQEMYDIKIEVYGFDTGKGLPKPTDYRDLPQMWNEGAFSMDIEKLKKQLTKAKLIIGDIKDTIDEFLSSEPAPVAFIAFDIDLYTSTMNAFKLLKANDTYLLPRVNCYFDDIMGYSYGDFNGERLAISDFNNTNEKRKISQVYNLKYYLPGHEGMWNDKFFMAHIFDHKLYAINDGLLINSEMYLEVDE